MYIVHTHAGVGVSETEERRRQRAAVVVHFSQHWPNCDPLAEWSGKLNSKLADIEI